MLTVQQALDLLMEIREELGPDAQVFMGNFYADVPVEDVVIEDGYPLIVNKDIW